MQILGLDLTAGHKMSCHSEIQPEPETVILACQSCRRLFEEIVADHEAKERAGGYLLLCIKCDPNALVPACVVYHYTNDDGLLVGVSEGSLLIATLKPLVGAILTMEDW